MWLSLFTLWVACSFAGDLSEFTERALPFYKAMDSAFPSGEMGHKELLAATVRRHQLRYRTIHKDGTTLKVPSEPLHVVSEFDVTQTSLHLASGRTLWHLRQTEQGHLLWDNERKIRQWLNEREFTPDPTDLGYVFVLQEKSLYTEPNAKSSQKILAAGTRLQWQGFDHEFLKVRVLGENPRTGFITTDHIVMRFDFATHIMTHDKKWHRFSHRDGGQLVTAQLRRFRLDQVRALLTKPQLGILTVAIPGQGWVPRSHVVLGPLITQDWQEAVLKKHGTVYWRDLGPVRQPNRRIAQSELLKRQIFSVANWQDLIAVSSDGVYLSNDGQTFRELPTFGRQNLPVAFDQQGRLFVGRHFSTDGGKSFQPFFRFEDVGSLLEQAKIGLMPGLRLVDIEIDQKNQIRLEVDTGVRKKTLRGNARYGLVTDWRL